MKVAIIGQLKMATVFVLLVTTFQVLPAKSAATKSSSDLNHKASVLSTGPADAAAAVVAATAGGNAEETGYDEDDSDRVIPDSVRQVVVSRRRRSTAHHHHQYSLRSSPPGYDNSWCFRGLYDFDNCPGR